MNKIEEIKEYISLLENSSLSVLEIEKEDGTKIHLEKEHPAQQIFNASPIGAYQPTATDVPAPARRIGTGQGSFCSCRKESKQGLNRLHYRGYEVHERNSG